jgi:hypothetical protein
LQVFCCLLQRQQTKRKQGGFLVSLLTNKQSGIQVESYIRTMALSVRTLKPAGEWSDKEVAQAPYDLKHLHGPPLTGRALTAFRLLCENVVTKEVLYTFYMAKNQLPEVWFWFVLWGGGQWRGQRGAAVAAAVVGRRPAREQDQNATPQKQLAHRGALNPCYPPQSKKILTYTVVPEAPK